MKPPTFSVKFAPFRPSRTFVRIWLLAVLSLGVIAATHSGEAEPVQATHENTLKVAFSEFPPFCYTDADGVIKGYAITILREILDDINRPYELNSRPTARIYHQLKVGEVDIWIGPKGVPTLLPHVSEVLLPDDLSINLYLWRKLGTPEALDVLDLQHQNVAVINGFSYSGLINELRDPENNIELFRTSSHSNALKMLLSGRSDYLLNYQRPIEILLAEHPEARLLRTQIQHRKLALIVSKKAAGRQQLVQRLSDSVKKRDSDIPR